MEDVAVVLYVFAALPLVDVYAGRCADKDSCAHHVELCIGRVSFQQTCSSSALSCSENNSAIKISGQLKVARKDEVKVLERIEITKQFPLWQCHCVTLF